MLLNLMAFDLKSDTIRSFFFTQTLPEKFSKYSFSSPEVFYSPTG